MQFNIKIINYSTQKIADNIFSMNYSGVVESQI